MTVLTQCKGCDERISSRDDPAAFKDRINGQIFCARCREEVMATLVRVPHVSGVPYALAFALAVAIIAIGGWAAGWI